MERAKTGIRRSDIPWSSFTENFLKYSRHNAGFSFGLAVINSFNFFFFFQVMVLFTVNTANVTFENVLKSFATRLKPRFGLPVNKTATDSCYFKTGLSERRIVKVFHMFLALLQKHCHFGEGMEMVKQHSAQFLDLHVGH